MSDDDDAKLFVSTPSLFSNPYACHPLPKCFSVSLNFFARCETFQVAPTPTPASGLSVRQQVQQTRFPGHERFDSTAPVVSESLLVPLSDLYHNSLDLADQMAANVTILP